MRNLWAPPKMKNYERAYTAFRWEIPDTFNFGTDVVDVLATESDRPALIWTNRQGTERRYTFRDISRLSNRLANGLAERGLEKGDRVLVMLPRIPEWMVAMVACLKLGTIPIPSIEMLTTRDIEYRLTHSKAKGVITTRSNIGKVPSEFLGVRLSVGGGEGWIDWEDVLLASENFSAPVVAAEDPAILYYTSGSTGHPKGVTHSARALFAWRLSAYYWLDLSSDDLIWCTADTGWSKAGTSILFGPWSCGSVVFFYDGPFEPARRFELLEQYRVTVFCAAATELRRLIGENISGRDLSALRLTVSAGETVNPDVVKRWVDLTGVPLLEAFGQTESLMSVCNYPALAVKAGSMGRPLPGTVVEIIDDKGDILPPDQPGLIAIRLPNAQLMLGYWDEPDRMEEFIRTSVTGDRWFLTGDTALRDEDGYLSYLGRADDVINSAGYRIGPLEVENALMEHPAVQECAVVASPDPDRGEIVKAFIVLAPGCSPSDDLSKSLQDHTKRTTAPYKYPRRVEFVDDLPKTPTGKIRRRELRDREFGRSP